MLSKSRPTGLFILLVIALLFIPFTTSYAETINYIYDDLNRLIWIGYGNGKWIEYVYDEVGNREEKAFIPCRLLADLNLDGAVNILDVIKLNRISLGTDPVQGCSDANTDNAVDISDIVLTVRMSLGTDPLQCCNE